MKKVTVGVILFGEKYLNKSIKSLLNQDYQNIDFVFRDQEEGKYSAFEWLSKNMPEAFKKADIKKEKNLWHSGGHNKIINNMTDDIYICASYDMLYPKDMVSKIVKSAEENKDATVFTAKLMRWDFENDKKTNFIDSLGIGITDYHYLYDFGQGEKDIGQYDDMNDIFGVTGAFFAITKKGLESIRYKDEYFDKNLHYRNDCDLSYRLRWAGNKIQIIHDLKLYHDRQVANNGQSLKLRQAAKALWVKESSYLGDRIIMMKNYSKKYPIKVRVKTFLYHFLKRAYLLTTTPELFKTIKKVKSLKTETLEKRKAMKRIVSESEIVKLMK